MPAESTARFDPNGAELYAELQVFGAPIALAPRFLLRTPLGDEQAAFPDPPAPWNGAFVTARIPIAPAFAQRWQVLAIVTVLPGEGATTRLALVVYQGHQRIGETPAINAPVPDGDEYARATIGPIRLREGA